MSATPGTERVGFEQQKNWLHSNSDRADLIGKRRNRPIVTAAYGP